MRRFRIRRRRAAALALLPVIALTTTAAISIAAQRQAQIDPAKRDVKIGKRVVLHGKFPDAPNAEVSVEHRRAGRDYFVRVTTTRTNDYGGYTVRVKPRSTGFWRGILTAPAPARTDAGVLDDGSTATADSRTDSDRVGVISKTKAKVSKRHTLTGDAVRIRGRVKPGNSGRRVVIKAGGERLTTRTDGDGRFSERWAPPSTGTYKVKVRARGDRVAARSKDRAGRVIAYRRAEASYYGPGFYGNTTACGQTLSPGMVGVAHKTMPCGTKLKLRYGSNTVTVRVIDRGPYAGDREFDLTEETRNRLGFPSTGTVLTSK